MGYLQVIWYGMFEKDLTVRLEEGEKSAIYVGEQATGTGPLVDLGGVVVYIPSTGICR